MGKWNVIKEKWLKKDVMLIMVLTGVLLLVISWPIGGEQERNGENTKTAGSVPLSLVADRDLGMTDSGTESRMWAGEDGQAGVTMSYEREMEQRLLAILSRIQGVGEVQVMITLRTSRELLLDKEGETSKSETMETDAAGGQRKILQQSQNQSTVMVDGDGQSVPVMIKTIYPEIEGVVVVAQGAGTGDVSRQISEVVQVLLGVDAHRVKIVRMK